MSITSSAGAVWHSDLHAQTDQSGTHCDLPATWRASRGNIARPEDDLASFVTHDLLPVRLNNIHNHLWILGRMLPPRPLHIQLLMSRAVTIVEDIDMHLVWTKGRIAIKPLPRYLLDEVFCKEHIDGNPELVRCAQGVFYTYTALVASESDFRIALDTGLLPKTVDWPAWRGTVGRFVEKHSAPGQNIYSAINKRYLYGELSLNRLNTVYRWLRGSLLYGYWRETSLSLYNDFFADNLGKFAGALAYVVIVLTAMQAGLANDLIQNDKAFKKAYYVFTIFSIVAPLAITVTVFAVFIVMFFAHWARTQHDQIRRYQDMDIPPSKRESVQRV